MTSKTFNVKAAAIYILTVGGGSRQFAASVLNATEEEFDKLLPVPYRGGKLVNGVLPELHRGITLRAGWGWVPYNHYSVRAGDVVYRMHGGGKVYKKVAVTPDLVREMHNWCKNGLALVARKIWKDPIGYYEISRLDGENPAVGDIYEKDGFICKLLASERADETIKYYHRIRRPKVPKGYEIYAHRDRRRMICKGSKVYRPTNHDWIDVIPEYIGNYTVPHTMFIYIRPIAKIEESKPSQSGIKGTMQVPKGCEVYHYSGEPVMDVKPGSRCARIDTAHDVNLWIKSSQHITSPDLIYAAPVPIAVPAKPHSDDSPPINVIPVRIFIIFNAQFCAPEAKYWSGAANTLDIAARGVANPSACKFTAPVSKGLVTDAIVIIPCEDAAIASIESVPNWTKN